MQAAAVEVGREQSTRLGEDATAPDGIEVLLAQSRDPDPRARKRAVRQLCPCGLKRNHHDVWDRLVAMAADEDPSVRRDVLHVLCDGSPREREAEVVRAIEGMHDDPDPHLRRRVRKVLAQYRKGGRINVL
jgi:hypothetical protein